MRNVGPIYHLALDPTSLIDICPQIVTIYHLSFGLNIGRFTIDDNLSLIVRSSLFFVLVFLLVCILCGLWTLELHLLWHLVFCHTRIFILTLIRINLNFHLNSFHFHAFLGLHLCQSLPLIFFKDLDRVNLISFRLFRLFLCAKLIQMRSQIFVHLTQVFDLDAPEVICEQLFDVVIFDQQFFVVIRIKTTTAFRVTLVGLFSDICKAHLCDCTSTHMFAFSQNKLIFIINYFPKNVN